MRKETVLDALKQMREHSKQRKFNQSVDLTLNFKGLDFKKPNSAFKVDVTLPFPIEGKAKSKSIVFVKDKQFASQIKGKVTRIVMEDEIQKISKKEIEQIASEYDILLSEGPVTLTVAKHMGQILAPKGKMPKPISLDIKSLESTLQKSSSSTTITNRKGKIQPLIHIKIGSEQSKDEELAQNLITIYNAVEEKLPAKKQNIKSVFVKTTMGVPIQILDKEVIVRKKPDKKAEKESKKIAKESSTVEGEAQ